MRRNARDLVAAVLLVAVLVPYAWFLVSGRWPTSIGDVGGMVFVGLTFGVTALLLQTSGDRWGRRTRLEEVLVGVVLALGTATLLLSETTAAVPLLAVFMAVMLLAWAVDAAAHAEPVRRSARTVRV